MPSHVDRGLFDLDKINNLRGSPWLKDVFDDKLLFEHIRDAISSVNTKDPPYNPYLYESLMTDVSRSLDRCLAYRRESASLESQAVGRALEYDLFNKTALKDTALNELITDTKALTSAKAGQSATGSGLDSLGDNPLRKFAPAYLSGAQATDDSIKNQNDKREILKERLALLQEYQDTLQQRHTTPGHALNYAERRGRVITLIKQEVAEAYQKAMAARAGLIKQLSLTENANYPFPVIAGNDTDIDFLDRLVLWAREMIRVYEIYTEDEITVELVIPIGSPYYNNFATPTPFAPYFYTVTSLANALNDPGPQGGILTVDLRSALPAALRVNGSYDPKVRLRGIGLSSGAAMGADLTDSWSAVIVLPEQPNPYDVAALRTQSVRSRATIKRPPVVLGRFLPYRADISPALSAGEEVWNVDPTTDATNIFIQPLALSGPGSLGLRGTSELKDIKLHLRIAARPSQALRDWMKGPLPTAPLQRGRKARLHRTKKAPARRGKR
jgi:hypothetical protein